MRDAAEQHVDGHRGAVLADRDEIAILLLLEFNEPEGGVTFLDAGLTALAATLGCFTAATGTFAAALASLGAGVAILGEALAGFAVARARAEGAIFGAGLDGFGASAAGLVFFAGLLAALRSGSFGFASATSGRENGASIASSGGLGRNRVAAPAPKSAAMLI